MKISRSIDSRANSSQDEVTITAVKNGSINVDHIKVFEIKDSTQT